jgi:hypothetical protein
MLFDRIARADPLLMLCVLECTPDLQLQSHLFPGLVCVGVLCKYTAVREVTLMLSAFQA